MSETNETLTIAALTGDLVIFRELQPCDPDLPDFATLRADVGLPNGQVPRKRDAEYARVVLRLLQTVQLRRNLPPLRLLLVIGDTENDRMMGDHLRRTSGLPTFIFLGKDDLSAEPALTTTRHISTATRWSLIEAWLEQVQQQSPLADTPDLWPRVAVLLDIDKTLLGPRGRGDHEINTARAEAALRVAQDLLGDRVDIAQFEATYAELCKPSYHSLTLDNQDYTVYITLLISAGIFSLDDLRHSMSEGTMTRFSQVLAAARPRLPATLNELHAAMVAAHEAGDPTPFKAFRHAEFAATVARMQDGRLRLCREVVNLTRNLAQRGVLCMAASDKPDEASLPSPEQAAAGLLPLHHTPALID